MMSLKETIGLIRSDKKRCIGFGGVLFHILYRLGSYFKQKKGLHYKFLFLLTACFYYPYMRFLGNDIPLGINLGAGLSLTHLLGIVIGYKSKIGNNCTIYQNVTIGINGYRAGFGFPTIGDNVVICAGAIVIGNITIGNNVVIAAGSVVNKDVPSGVIVGGVPSRVLSEKGLEESDLFIKEIGHKY